KTLKMIGLRLEPKSCLKIVSNDNDWQIVELLKIKLESKSIDADIYNQFITDMCYAQAKVEYNKRF
ncbi:MAG: hypothetical protein J6562_04140, partial [Candidatus Schmidhempelia sp.]|nr:hypothetical protein [Candidatus Schmidhempelia sp.]